MFPNLNAEQARRGKTDVDMANCLQITRETYARKKKLSRFTFKECRELCLLFNCSFEYLFATENEIAETKEV